MFKFQTLAETNGPCIMNTPRCKPITEVAQVSASCCHSCAAFCLLCRARVDHSNVFS